MKGRSQSKVRARLVTQVEIQAYYIHLLATTYHYDELHGRTRYRLCNHHNRNRVSARASTVNVHRDFNVKLGPRLTAKPGDMIVNFGIIYATFESPSPTERTLVGYGQLPDKTRSNHHVSSSSLAPLPRHQSLKTSFSRGSATSRSSILLK